MTHLFLHVGMPKTGSTSIQATFFANRAVLAAHGIHYLDAARNHHRLIAAGFAGAMARAPDAAALAARQTIAAFIGRAGEGRIVISSEVLCRMAREEIAALLGFLRPLVGRISVVCFVRPPSGYITSGLQHDIRAGLPLERLGHISPPRYRSHIRKFLQERERADTILVLHDRTTLLRGCSIATMLAICGAPAELYDRLALRQENASASRPGLALMLAMTAAGLPGKAAAREAAAQRRRREALRLVHALPGPRFSIPDAVIEAVLSRPDVAADIAWVERRLGRAFPRAPAPTDGDHWPSAGLTSLDHAAMTALAALLRAEPPRQGRAAALRQVEAWLAENPAEAVLPWPELVALAGHLIGTGEAPGG